MIKNIKKEFMLILDEVEWMDDETRNDAKKKVCVHGYMMFIFIRLAFFFSDFFFVECFIGYDLSLIHFCFRLHFIVLFFHF